MAVGAEIGSMAKKKLGIEGHKTSYDETQIDLDKKAYWNLPSLSIPNYNKNVPQP